MKTVVLNAFSLNEEIFLAIKEKTKWYFNKLNYKIDFVNLREKKIVYCTGCSYCTEKEAGICIRDDDMRKIYPKISSSEIHIYLTPISFGGFNSDLKKIIDRFSPLYLPTYSLKENELHHPSRYSSPQKILFIGVLNKDELQRQEETFRLVTRRLKTASFADDASTIILKNEWPQEKVSTAIKNGFSELGLIS